MKKRKIIILIIVLTIGFASISTSLIMNGVVGIGSNIQSFDIYFSQAILDNVDVSGDTISSDGKEINFSTKKLTIEGEKSILEYKVKNASTQYDGEVTINCNFEDNNEININDYIDFNYYMDSQIIKAGREEEGIFSVRLKKAVTEEMQTSIKCELVVNAIEKNIDDVTIDNLDSEPSYSFSGVLLDNEGNPLVNKTLVIYPEPVIYVTTDENGYVNIPELSKDHSEIYVVEDVSMEEIKQMNKEEVIANASSNTGITISDDNITFTNGYEAVDVEMVENPIKKKGYSFYGYLRDENNNVVSNGNLVVYSENPHYAVVDARGYFYIDGLEDGSHEVYYLTGEMNDIKQLNKQEVKSRAQANTKITTSTRNITLSNKYKIENYVIEKERVRKYNITLNPNGGILNERTKQVVQNQQYGILATPVREGYTFQGWYLNNEKIEENYLVTLSESHTLEARWSANSYTVTFDSNNGSAVSQTLNVVYDETYGTLPTPTRTGYTFNGWYTAKSGGTKVESTTKVSLTNNQVLYAIWDINQHNVVVNKGTGIASVTGGGSYNYGETVTITATVATGYTWQKWSGTKESTNISFSFTMPDSDVTETASATINQYTLTFDSMGGSAVSSKKINYNAQYGTLTNPTWSGYTFNGWYTAKSGGTKVSNTTKMAAKNVTVYAQWTKNSVAKGDAALDFGSVKNWIVLSVSGNNIRLVSKSPIGSWTETGEDPNTEVSRINTASRAYILKNSAGSTIATPSGNLTLADLNSYNGASYSLNSTVSAAIFKSGTYWLATNCTERYGGPYYVSGGVVKYAYYSDSYVDSFGLRPVVTVNKSHLKWDSSKKVWTVI